MLANPPGAAAPPRCSGPGSSSSSARILIFGGQPDRRSPASTSSGSVFGMLGRPHRARHGAHLPLQPHPELRAGRAGPGPVGRAPSASSRSAPCPTCSPCSSASVRAVLLGVRGRVRHHPPVRQGAPAHPDRRHDRPVAAAHRGVARHPDDLGPRPDEPEDRGAVRLHVRGGADHVHAATTSSRWSSPRWPSSPSPSSCKSTNVGIAVRAVGRALGPRQHARRPGQAHSRRWCGALAAAAVVHRRVPQGGRRRAALRLERGLRHHQLRRAAGRPRRPHARPVHQPAVGRRLGGGPRASSSSRSSGTSATSPRRSTRCSRS